MFTSNTSICVQTFTCSVNRDTYFFLICDGSEYLKMKKIAALLVEKLPAPGGQHASIQETRGTHGLPHE